ncbi:MAG: gamma-glutamyltransferase [Planctomycetes bacterium]|nr:gamma-glutamyltransferase [Planctomycetota bacterium]
MRFLIVTFGLCVLAVPASAQPKAETVESKGGVVVCVSPLAADVGVDILKRGGNAVDAAVAVAFAQAVTWPAAGNIGGGGFMMIAAPGKEVRCIEYRETAPASAKVDLFADGTVGVLDHKAAGVPGTVRGLALAHGKYGKLPWGDVVMPAVKLAEDGFVMNAALAGDLNGVLASSKTTNAEFKRVYGKPGGKEWAEGDKLVLKDLGKTLRVIAEKGADAFYTGEPAELLAKEMKANGGLITKDDLAAYKANDRTPIRTTYRGFDVYGPPPPSSGGLCISQMLNVLENYDLKKLGRWSPETTHLMIETMRRTYADRARSLGDPGFTTIPTTFQDREYAKKLSQSIDPKKATPSAQIATDIVLNKESDSTTHFSIIDKDGMAVSNTYTLENSYGNRVVVPGAGYILNNEMTDFNPKPGITNTKGQIGTKPNQIQPGKRMLSSQTPVIVMKDGKPVLITGSPGGRTIINTVLCVVVNVIDFEMPVAEAVSAPRTHHQWFPDVARFEGASQHPKLVAELKKMGHTVVEQFQGDAHTIGINPKTGVRVGVADKRIDGKAAKE